MVTVHIPKLLPPPSTFSLSLACSFFFLTVPCVISISECSKWVCHAHMSSKRCVKTAWIHPCSPLSTHLLALHPRLRSPHRAKNPPNSLLRLPRMLRRPRPVLQEP